MSKSVSDADTKERFSSTNWYVVTRVTALTTEVVDGKKCSQKSRITKGCIDD